VRTVWNTQMHRTICISQETHYIPPTDPGRLMLLGETVAVYCENRTEQRPCSARSPHETYYVSATEPNRLILFGEIVTVYCEIHTEYTNTYTVDRTMRFHMWCQLGFRRLIASQCSVWLQASGSKDRSTSPSWIRNFYF
jgi:hypothetical protein